MTKVDSYEPIAAEYYDSVKHPTCADFRNATETLLHDFFRTISMPIHPSLEIGAGKSLVAEVLQARGLPVEGLVLSDAVPAMLAYSKVWMAHGARLMQASVEELDFAEGTFRSIFACLGDPFNDSLLWKKIARWLSPQGFCFFSTPAHEWVAHYRPSFQSGHTEVAEFLVEGKSVFVRSKVLPDAEQRALIETEGLRVLRKLSFTRAAFHGRARSPKVNLPHIDDNTPIVSAYLVERTATQGTN